MSNIATKLSEMSAVKSALKGALTAKGIDMTDVPFNEYASKIDEINMGIDTSKVKVSALNKGSYYWTGTSTVTVNGTVVFYVGGGSNNHNIGSATITYLDGTTSTLNAQFVGEIKNVKTIVLQVTSDNSTGPGGATAVVGYIPN